MKVEDMTGIGFSFLKKGVPAIFFGALPFLFIFPFTQPRTEAEVKPPPSTATREMEIAAKTASKKEMELMPVAYTPPDITRGDRDTMEVSITFDGGFDGNDAELILDTLKERGIKTTMFLTGGFMRRHPEITRRIVSEGHEVGNHTMSHPHLTEYAKTFKQKTLPGVDRAFLKKELARTRETFTAITGAEMIPLWRAPYGEVNSELRAWAYGEGYVHIGWTQDWKHRETLDTLDWVVDRDSRFYRTPQEIKEKILDFGDGRGGLRGGIILMHLGSGRGSDSAALVLGEMIDELSERGYRFVKVSTLVEDESSVASVFKRHGLPAPVETGDRAKERKAPSAG